MVRSGGSTTRCSRPCVTGARTLTGARSLSRLLGSRSQERRVALGELPDQLLLEVVGPPAGQAGRSGEVGLATAIDLLLQPLLQVAVLASLDHRLFVVQQELRD